MPRGKYVNHKGRGRSFTSPEELAREQKDMANKRRQRAERGDDEESSEEEPEKQAAEKEESEESSSEEEEEDHKTKGVEGLLQGQIENPNRRVVKPKKLSQLEDTSGGSTTAAAASSTTGTDKPELSRREREAIEKQKAKERYQKLHAEGKTEEARKDLARLAIIRKQREEAAAKRALEQQEKDAAKSTKQSETAKALGKK